MTTTDLPAGPELDRAVAIALGYTVEDGPFDVSFAGVKRELALRYKSPNGGWTLDECLPPFSTDHAALPEQFDWIKVRGWMEIIMGEQPRWSATAHLDKSLGVDPLVDCRGDDLPLAVARLVLKVAERMEKP